jgi:hypothetical protein
LIRLVDQAPAVIAVRHFARDQDAQPEQRLARLLERDGILQDKFPF